MSATGTITLTRNSTSVAGSGTDFSSDLAVGGFIVATVGGTTYTLGIKSIESNTALTLQIAYKGATTSAVAFDYVPFATLNLITSALAAQVNEALRANNLDRDNWQQIFSGTGNVTVTLPDGTTWTGPAWRGISDTVNNKMDKSQNLNDVADKATARANLGWVNGFLPITLGGTGGKTKADAWTALATFGDTAGTAAQGNDKRLNSVDGKSGGSVSSQIFVNQQSSDVADLPLILRRSQYVNGVWFGGGIRFYLRSDLSQEGADMYIQRNSNGERLFYQRIFNGDGSVPAVFSFSSNGSYYAYNGSFQSLSDKRIKDEIETIKDPLAKMKKISGVTFRRRDTGNWGIGFIAQDVETVFPEAVSDLSYDVTLKDGSVVKGVKSPDTANVAAALHHEAILALMDIVEDLKTEISKRDTAIQDLQERLKALDGLDK